MSEPDGLPRGYYNLCVAIIELAVRDSREPGDSPSLIRQRVEARRWLRDIGAPLAHIIGLTHSDKVKSWLDDPDRSCTDGEFCIIADASRQTGVSKVTIYRWIAEDRVRNYKARNETGHWNRWVSMRDIMERKGESVWLGNKT